MQPSSPSTRSSLTDQDAERMRHAGFAAGGEAVEGGASEHDRVRAECQRLHHVGPAAETAVDDEREARADGAHDLRQHLERATQ